MKRILLFSLLSTLLLTSCMAVQVVGSVAGGAVMVSGYALGANAVTKKVKKKKDKKKKVQKEEVLAYRVGDYTFVDDIISNILDFSEFTGKKISKLLTDIVS